MNLRTARLVSTDSDTTTVDGLGIVGWRVHGIEMEAAILDQPVDLRPTPMGFEVGECSRSSR